MHHSLLASRFLRWRTLVPLESLHTKSAALTTGLVWGSLAGCEVYLTVSLNVRDVFEEGNDNRED